MIRTCSAAAVLAVALAASLAGTAGAATRSTTAAASFCSVSKTVGVEIANIGKSVQNATVSRQTAGLKKQLQDIRNASGSLKSSAPKRLKPSLTAGLNFVNLVYRTLAGVHWNLLTLIQNPQKAAPLEAASATFDSRIAPLKTYYRKTCKLRI